MPANVHFLRKLASDELMDTLFFATGERVVKKKEPTHWVLSAGGIDVKIVTNRKIILNSRYRCKTVPDAKLMIQEMIS